jgi:hypothetical protein
VKKILLLPGWMTSIDLFESQNDLNVRIGKLNEEDLSADYIIGVSLGALVTLKNLDQIKGKVVLVNPPLPKRSILTWFVKWVNYTIHEGLFLERQHFTKNPIRLGLEMVNCIKLLGADFSEALANFPHERLTVIRGKDDRFFCDDKAVLFLRSLNIKLVEYGGGHNLSLELEKTLDQIN